MARQAEYLNVGDRIDYANDTGSDIAVGDVVELNERIGVALVDIADGETGAVKTEGHFNLPAVTGSSFSVGDQVYWNTSSAYVTTTSTDNTPAGWVTAPKGSSVDEANVKIG